MREMIQGLRQRHRLAVARRDWEEARMLLWMLAAQMRYGKD